MTFSPSYVGSSLNFHLALSNVTEDSTAAE